MLSENTIKEIISVSNHETKESILKAVEYGLLEVYKNKDEFVSSGWSLENKNHYSILSDNKVVYFE